jgi:hypothetical protein
LPKKLKNENNQFSIFHDPTPSIQNKENISNTKFCNNSEKPQRKFLKKSKIPILKKQNNVHNWKLQAISKSI